MRFPSDRVPLPASVCYSFFSMAECAISVVVLVVRVLQHSHKRLLMGEDCQLLCFVSLLGHIVSGLYPYPSAVKGIRAAVRKVADVVYVSAERRRSLVVGGESAPMHRLVGYDRVVVDGVPVKSDFLLHGRMGRIKVHLAVRNVLVRRVHHELAFELRALVQCGLDCCSVSSL